MRTLKCCRAAAVAAALSLVTFSAFAAETLPAPKEWVHGFINGYFTIVWYAYDGATALPVEVQMKDKGADDSTYKTLFRDVGSTGHYTYNTSYEVFWKGLGLTAATTSDYKLKEYIYKTNFYGTASFRMRSNNGTDTSAWVTLEDSTSNLRLTGTKIYSSNISGNISLPDDGKLQLMIDVKDSWYGLDLGQTRKVRGIRYYSRSGPCFYRINGAYVQYADNAAFVDAVTPFTIDTSDTSTADQRHITFLRFAEPVETRYVRLCSSTLTDRILSLDEFEVVAAQQTVQPTAAVSHSFDGAYGWPKLTWTVPASAYPVSNRVLRATSEVGPFAAVTDWAEGTGSTFVDTGADLKPSVTYYYEVEVWCNHPALQDETDDKVIVSSPVSVTHIRRLDRDASTGALQTGVSYMTLTTGVASAYMPLSFDGDASTFPDTETLRFGPVGLKFDQATWVSTFGYICRPNVYCKRIKETALYSTDADDTALDNRVCRSAHPTETDQLGTLFYLDANSIPEDGARQYFLWLNDPTTTTDDCFFGNVAELQFYGWNQDDIDNAGVLLPPSDVALTKITGGVRVTWGVSTAASGGYDVERRVRGTDEWTAIASLSDRTATSYDDTGLATGNYEYRVVAKRGEDTAASAVVSTIYYVPGSGTGLKSAVYYPYRATDPALSCPTGSCERGVEVPNLTFAADDAFAPNVFSNAVLAMKGRLIVPIAGTYTFRFDVADGAAVFVDDAWVANKWVSGSASDSVELTAGEHEIAIHARLESAANRVKLYWSGPVEEELIPATQLVPSDAAYAFDRGDGWSVRILGGAVRGEVFGTMSDATVTIRAGNQSAANWRTDPRIVFLGRSCSSSFQIKARAYDPLTASGAGHYGFLVRAPNGNSAKFYSQGYGHGNGEGYISVLTNGVSSLYTPVGPVVFSGNTFDMKLDYAKHTGTFTFGMKLPTAKNYTTVGTWTNDGAIPDTFEVGYFSGGYANGRNYNEIQLSNRRFREKKGLAIILK